MSVLLFILTLNPLVYFTKVQWICDTVYNNKWNQVIQRGILELVTILKTSQIPADMEMEFGQKKYFHLIFEWEKVFPGAQIVESILSLPPVG